MIYLHRATFDEMDYAQVTFFGRHFYWMEQATEAWLMEKQMGFAVLTTYHNIGLPVISAETRYRAPVNLEQTVEVRVALRDLTRRGFSTPFEIVRQDDGVLAAFGLIKRRAIDVKRFRGIDLPDDFYVRFEEMQAESRDMVIRQE